MTDELSTPTTPDRPGARRGAEVGGQVGTQVGAALGAATEQASERAAEAAALLAEGYGSLRRTVLDGLQEVDARALVRQAGDVLEGVLEDGRDRASTALAALPGRRRQRRWPWALAAAVAGAAAGLGAGYAARRVVGQDAPGALEPEQLRAVVDPQPVVPGTDGHRP